MASQSLLVIELIASDNTGSDSNRDSLSARDSMQQMTERLSKQHGLNIDFRRTSNPETVIQCLSQAAHFDGLVINIGQYAKLPTKDQLDAMRSHIGVATIAGKPVIEVCYDNVFAQSFSNASPGDLRASGLVCGFGQNGYLLAIESAAQQLSADCSQ